jgi:drug/metabolite transporter (DMT)-like permease
MVAWWIGFSIIHILIPYVTEFTALQSMSPSCSALIYNLTPFFSAFFSYIYFNELMTRQKWLGFLIGFSGIAWFIHSQSVFCINLNIAYLLVLISVISGALGWIYVRKLVLQGYAPLLINGIAMLLGGLQSFALSYAMEGSVSLPWGQMHSFSVWLAMIILLTNVVYYNLYAQLLKRYTVTLLSFMGCIIPLFTAFFDWMLLDIAVSSHFFVALLVAGFGVYLFYQEELRQGYIKS